MLHGLQHHFTCYQWPTHDVDVSMQHERNISRRILNETENEAWEQIELEFGPLDQISDAELKHLLEIEMRVAASIHGKQTLRVPFEVTERVITTVLAKCRRNGSADDRLALIKTERLLRGLCARNRADKLRPKHRPRKNWFLRRAEKIACHELKQRQRELMYVARLSSGDALNRAAEEIAPGYYVQPATLISWWANPGRRRRK